MNPKSITTNKQTIGFVNRRNELESIFLEPGQMSRYWVVDAPAGYGKSQLLAEAEKRYQESDWLSINVEFPRRGATGPTDALGAGVNRYKGRVYVSYAWGGESEKTVDELEYAFEEHGIRMMRDKKDLDYKGSIKEFEQRIGRGETVVLVISDKYLRSEHCMYELLEISENQEMRKRIFPIVLGDAKIYKSIDRVQYIGHWDKQIDQLNKAIKKVKVMTNISSLHDNLDKFARIRAGFDHLVDMLSDMNALTPEQHAASGYITLINSLQSTLAESEPAEEADEPSFSKEIEPAKEIEIEVSLTDLVVTPILTQLGKQHAAREGYTPTWEEKGMDIAGALLAKVDEPEKPKSKPIKGFAIIIDNLECCPNEDISSFLQILAGIFEGLKNGNYFAREKQLRILISGRYARNKLKLASGDMGMGMAEMALAPFTYDVILSTIQEFAKQKGNFGLPQAEEMAAHLLYISGGHPGFTAEILNELAEARFTRGVKQLNATHYQSKFTEKFYQQLLQESPRLKDHLLINVLVSLSPFRKYDRWFFLKELRERGFLPEDLDEETLEKGLLGSYLINLDQGFLHDGVYRNLLEMWLRLHNPSLYADLCNVGVEIYKKRISSGGNIRRYEKWAIEFILMRITQLYHVEKAESSTLIAQMQKEIEWVIGEIAKMKYAVSPEDIYSLREDLILGLREDAELRFLYNFCTAKEGKFDSGSYAKFLAFTQEAFQKNLS